MKNELKISTLSIVCVLCTAVSIPSFGASAVRSLGGAGTYSSASSAASAGTDTTRAAATNSVRGGSMRVSNAKPATASSSTRTSATRASATPRLSIGKYLANVGATGSGVSSGTIKPGQSAANGVEARVDRLEEALGLGEFDGNFSGVIVDVQKLQKDLNEIAGQDNSVVATFEDGVLEITQGGESVLSAEIASAQGLDELQEKLDNLTDSFAAKSDFDALSKAVDSLDLVVKGLSSESGDFGESIENLQLAIDSLDSMYATDTDLQDKLTAASDELKELIKQSDSGAAVESLQGQLDDLSADLTEFSEQIVANQQAIAGLDSTYATDDALKQLSDRVDTMSGGSTVSLEQVQQEIKSIQDTFETKVTEIVENTEINAAQIADGSITASKLSTDGLDSNTYGMLTVDPETGEAVWVPVMFVDDPDQVQ